MNDIKNPCLEIVLPDTASLSTTGTNTAAMSAGRLSPSKVNWPMVFPDIVKIGDHSFTSHQLGALLNILLDQYPELKL